MANKKKEQTKEKLSTNVIGVKIYRHMSKDLLALAVEFEAIEKDDGFGGYYATNEDVKFKEDMSFSIDTAIEDLANLINLNKAKNKKEKQIILLNQIKKQEELLTKIKTQKELNEKYNYEDEDLKLRYLKVLEASLQKEVIGNYMRLGKEGRREYEFVSIDGILYPFFFGSRIYRVYPDLTIKKKIFIQENQIFNRELNHNRENRIFTLGVIMLLVGFLFLSGNIFYTYKNYQAGNELDILANQGILECSNTMAILQNQYGQVITEYLQTKQEDLKILKNNQKYINNNNNNININPKTIN